MFRPQAAAALLLAFAAPAALAADRAAAPALAVSPAPVVKLRPRVPQFPADVKARRDRLWSAASPAVKAWVKQVAPGIANGTGDPEALARAALRARWPNLRSAAGSDALAFLAIYESAEILQAWARARDSLAELSEQQQLKMQMVMDRLSKMMAMLSNLLKKLSEVSDSIIANLK